MRQIQATRSQSPRKSLTTTPNQDKIEVGRRSKTAMVRNRKDKATKIRVPKFTILDSKKRLTRTRKKRSKMVTRREIIKIRSKAAELEKKSSLKASKMTKWRKAAKVKKIGEEKEVADT